jgi:hypothetical protein
MSDCPHLKACPKRNSPDDGWRGNWGPTCCSPQLVYPNWPDCSVMREGESDPEPTEAPPGRAGIRTHGESSAANKGISSILKPSGDFKLTVYNHHKRECEIAGGCPACYPEPKKD